jgi:predicted pyridoxine 5'-phosphate oxidase superfamily flavin-nucleotide-binding protein
MRYHAGELEVQERAGGSELASRIAGSIDLAIPAVVRRFLAERRMAIAATVDAQGRPWASHLAGERGFIRVLEDHLVRVDAVPAAGDPLVANLLAGGRMGLIVPDLATRRRVRLNGTIERADEGSIFVRTQEVYSNCPKYIQVREEEHPPPLAPATSRRAHSLDPGQRGWIRRADTFFVASFHPEAGADASHRGGIPGFVRVESDRLVWPDYQGNSMYNTLGNIAAYPRAGLVFPDFETGATLQLTGRAEIDWDPAHAQAIAGAQRLIAFGIEEVVEIQHAFPLSLRLREYSPFNPHD